MIDGTIFKKWFLESFIPVEIFLFEEKLPPKALLVLDNSSTQPDVDELIVNIKTFFFCQSEIQPLD